LEDEATTGAALAAMAMQSATFKALVLNGILTPQQATEVIDGALLMVEQSEGQSPHRQEAHSIARKLIEHALTPPPK
jgi:hypothetical protein